MAVENKYVNADVAAGKLGTAALVKVGDSFVLVTTFEVAAADDDGSIYRLAKNLSGDLIPIRVEIFNDALTGATDYDLGFYKTLTDGVGGEVIDKDVLMDGADISSGNGATSPQNGLTNVDLANRAQRIYELCGDTQATKEAGYDLALTANTVGSAAGTITVIAEFAQG